MSIWSNEEPNLDVVDFYSKAAICLSARAYHKNYCMDLSSSHSYAGYTKAPVCSKWSVKVSIFLYLLLRFLLILLYQEVLRCIGGVQALFPLLENVVQADAANSLAGPMLSPENDKPDVEGWEVLPSTSYSGNKI